MKAAPTSLARLTHQTLLDSSCWNALAYQVVPLRIPTNTRKENRFRRSGERQLLAQDSTQSGAYHACNDYSRV